MKTSGDRICGVKHHTCDEKCTMPRIIQKRIPTKPLSNQISGDVNAVPEGSQHHLPSTNKL